MMQFTRLIILLLMPTLLYAGDLDQAKADMSKGRYVAAIDNLQGIVAGQENNYEAWFLFGVAHVHEQQYSQAIEAFRHVIELRPSLAEPHNNLASVYNSLGDTDAAVKELEIALKKRPDFVVAEGNLADLYVKLALEHYRNSLKAGANPMIEERYARLLQVRTPITTSSKQKPAEKSAEQQSSPTLPTKKPEAKTMPPTSTTANKPTMQPEKTTAPETLAIASSTTANQEASKPSITDVLDALEDWRLAWSTQNLEAYFNAYADSYQPDKRFESIATWKAYKTRVIHNKKYIRVLFDKVDVTLPAQKDIATVKVFQSFQSNNYNSEGAKEIVFQHIDGAWKIIKEVSL